MDNIEHIKEVWLDVRAKAQALSDLMRQPLPDKADVLKAIQGARERRSILARLAAPHTAGEWRCAAESDMLKYDLEILGLREIEIELPGRKLLAAAHAALEQAKMRLCAAICEEFNSEVKVTVNLDAVVIERPLIETVEINQTVISRKSRAV
jgi:hypothetical protein